MWLLADRPALELLPVREPLLSMTNTVQHKPRLNAGVPIYALTQEVATRYKVSLFKGVFPVMMAQSGHDRDQVLRDVEDAMIATGAVEAADMGVAVGGVQAQRSRGG